MTYYKAYQEAYRAAHKAEAKAQGVLLQAKLKMDALNAYGGPKCSCCGEALLGALSIDHTAGDGAAFRATHGRGRLYRWLRENDYPPGFQVLCFSCNAAKGTGDHCPHQDAWL